MSQSRVEVRALSSCLVNWTVILIFLTSGCERRGASVSCWRATGRRRGGARAHLLFRRAVLLPWIWLDGCHRRPFELVVGVWEERDHLFARVEERGGEVALPPPCIAPEE